MTPFRTVSLIVAFLSFVGHSISTAQPASEIKLSETEPDYRLPAGTFSAAAARIGGIKCVAWTNRVDASDSEQRFVVEFDVNGTRGRVVESTARSVAPVHVVPLESEFLVLWNDARQGTRGLWGRTVDVSGTPTGTPTRLLQDLNSGSPFYSWTNGETSWAVWSTRTGSEDSTYLVRFDQDGSVSELLRFASRIDRDLVVDTDSNRLYVGLIGGNGFAITPAGRFDGRPFRSSRLRTPSFLLNDTSMVLVRNDSIQFLPSIYSDSISRSVLWHADEYGAQVLAVGRDSGRIFLSYHGLDQEGQWANISHYRKELKDDDSFGVPERVLVLLTVDICTNVDVKIGTEEIVPLQGHRYIVNAVIAGTEDYPLDGKPGVPWTRDVRYSIASDGGYYGAGEYPVLEGTSNTTRLVSGNELGIVARWFDDSTPDTLTVPFQPVAHKHADYRPVIRSVGDGQRVGWLSESGQLESRYVHKTLRLDSIRKDAGPRAVNGMTMPVPNRTGGAVSSYRNSSMRQWDGEKYSYTHDLTYVQHRLDDTAWIQRSAASNHCVLSDHPDGCRAPVLFSYQPYRDRLLSLSYPCDARFCDPDSYTLLSRDTTGTTLESFELPREPVIDFVWALDSNTYHFLTTENEYYRYDNDGYENRAMVPSNEETIVIQALYDSLVLRAFENGATGRIGFEVRDYRFRLKARTMTDYSLAERDMYVIQSPFDSTIGCFWGTSDGIAGVRYTTTLIPLPWTTEGGTSYRLFSTMGVAASWPSATFSADSVAVAFQRTDGDGTSQVWLSRTAASQFSNARQSEIAQTGSLWIAIAPNPVLSEATLLIKQQLLTSAVISLYQSNGSLIRTWERTLQPGTSELPLHMEGLPNGYFYLRVTTEEATESTTLLNLAHQR